VNSVVHSIVHSIVQSFNREICTLHADVCSLLMRKYCPHVLYACLARFTVRWRTSTMAQGADRGLQQAMQKAADTRVFTNAINGKKNKNKLGNPRVFIKRCVVMCMACERENVQRKRTSVCRFLAICRTATSSNDTRKLETEVHDFLNSDLALFKLHQTTVSLQRSAADSNVATLKKKQDELQGQIQASHHQPIHSLVALFS
jgi:hypothetical protein